MGDSGQAPAAALRRSPRKTTRGAGRVSDPARRTAVQSTNPCLTPPMPTVAITQSPVYRFLRTGRNLAWHASNTRGLDSCCSEIPCVQPHIINCPRRAPATHRRLPSITHTGARPFASNPAAAVQKHNSTAWPASCHLHYCHCHSHQGAASSSTARAWLCAGSGRERGRGGGGSR
jgi:hypothetical protein